MGLKGIIAFATVLLLLSTDVPSVAGGVGVGTCPYNINKRPMCQTDRDCGFNGQICCPSTYGFSTCVDGRTVG
ncbi:hypothetical protein R5R35_010411 [Gryllus longicercus]|uniref:WAP domain-containing protein n=1 Tax=Gryllus longicercus TaxID=2509291 RepID=A0AAN9Z3A8_9ORTH